MRSLGFLSTTVGRRLFARFLVTAFVPASLTGALAVTFVRAQVDRDVEQRVVQHAKRAGQGLLAGLDRYAWVLRAAVGGTDSLPPGFELIQRVPLVDGRPLSSGTGPSQLDPAQYEHLASGGTLLAIEREATPPLIWLGVPDSSVAGAEVVWGRVDREAFWGPVVTELGSDLATLCVTASDEFPVHCDGSLLRSGPAGSELVRRAANGQVVRYTDGDRDMHAASWSAFLKYQYASDDWRIVVSENQDERYASLAQFTQTLVAILVASLLGVFFLSHAQIRRTTEPLRQLQEGTRRLAGGDFSTAVEVSSQDEYAQLATSFNGMARVLDRQLTMLHRLDGLNAAVLGARELRPILTAATTEVGLLLPTTVVLAWVDRADVEPLAMKRDRAGQVSVTGPVPRMDLTFESAVRKLPKSDGQRLAGVLGEPCSTVFLAPLTDGVQAIGCVAIGFPDQVDLEPERSHAIRRLVDRLGLAVVDVLHVKHLDALGAGTLTAFARAIDANSPWTAGHSERVTGTALIIGHQLGLAPDELKVLRRGGLLHDIGKIGVPPQILDKAGPLTPAERQVIERHPVLGAEILEPIGPFNDVIPIVRSHHEKMDGSGYPDRLKGEAIPFLARVLAVADVFDALVSHRPYRSGMDLETALRIIRSGTGSHFDPDAASAFLAAAANGEVERLVVSTRSSQDLANTLDAGRKLVEAA